MAIKKQISKLLKKCGLKKFKAFCSSCKPNKSQNCENQPCIDQILEINAQENKENHRNSKRRSDEKPKPLFDTSLKPLNSDLQHEKVSLEKSVEKVSPEQYVEKETLEEKDMLGSVPIKLTVGEMQFTTRQQTLCAYPSYLSELFFIFRSPNTLSNSNPLHPQLPWPDNLFIDRD
ncbi:16241_t:CDS:2, partial [Racocetra persica]